MPALRASTEVKVQMRLLATFWDRLESWFVGHLEPPIRRNMRIELGATAAYGAFTTVLLFVPLVLRRLGAPAEALAAYSSLSYLGSVLAGFSLVLLRFSSAKGLISVCWIAARAAFLVVALVTGWAWLLALAILFALLDQLPAPAYSAIIQQIYPMAVRGKVMAAVRLGMALPILLLAPVAGLVLDHLGYQALFPMAGVVGIAGVLLFARMQVDEASLRPRRRRGDRSMWGILRHDRRFGFYLAALLLFGFGSLIPNPLYPILQADHLGLSYAAMGWLNLVFSVSRVLSYFYWGRRIDRWGGVRCLQIAFAVNAFVMLPYLWSSQGWMLAPSFVAMGIVNSAVDLGFVNAVIQLADPQQVPQYAALQATLVGARGLVGPFIGVALLRLGFDELPILALGAFLTLSAAFISRWVSTEPRPLLARRANEPA